MALVSLQSVSVGFGGPLLLDQVNLQIEKGENVALIGRNGEGKTTLLNVVAGRVAPDSGRVAFEKGIRIAGLPQDLPADITGSVRAIAVAGLQDESSHEAAALLTRLALDADDRFETLSVGFKRKVLLVKALAAQPDVLLLDEPTNHLDITTITWLEAYLSRRRGALVFITHDRSFMARLATRIITLDRGRLTGWNCDYKTFVERREAFLAVEENQRERFRRKLADEEAWIRQGIKARRTRNEGRVRALIRLREQQKAMRAQVGKVSFQIEQARRTGNLVIEAEDVYQCYGPRPIIEAFSTRIMRGDRVGIIGPNGAGKTTLLRLLLGEATPQKGVIRHGTHFQAVYFDQLRAILKEDATVQENIAGGETFIECNGRRRHVIGYLRDFLFSPDRARSPVRILSGGERNRLLLARLFMQPSNLLVLDEPTNDLDMETLELLEERLLDYAGTILLVSHDRAFINSVATATLVFEGDGKITEYAGGYDDWLIQRPPSGQGVEPAKTTVSKPSPGRAKPRKLTFNETRELEALPARIEALEAEQKSLFDQMAAPDFYKRPRETTIRLKARADALGPALEEAYARWQTLESIREKNK